MRGKREDRIGLCEFAGPPFRLPAGFRAGPAILRECAGRAGDWHWSMSDSGEWVRLPGLFPWGEVCDLFADEAGHDDAWRFTVVLDSVGADDIALYVVHAAAGSRARRRAARTSVQQLSGLAKP